MSKQGRGLAKRQGSVTRVRNRGVTGLFVRQRGGHSTLGVEHSRRCRRGDIGWVTSPQGRRLVGL